MIRKFAVISAVLGTLLGAACTTTTDPLTGKITKSLSPAAKTELSQFGNVTAQAIANAIATGATNSAVQYVGTGKVDTKQLAQAELYGVASNAQSYIGQLVPRSTIVASASTPAIQTALTNNLPSQVAVTQSTVDALQAAAAVNSPPK